LTLLLISDLSPFNRSAFACLIIVKCFPSLSFSIFLIPERSPLLHKAAQPPDLPIQKPFKISLLGCPRNMYSPIPKPKSTSTQKMSRYHLLLHNILNSKSRNLSVTPDLSSFLTSLLSIKSITRFYLLNTSYCIYFNLQPIPYCKASLFLARTTRVSLKLF
jgi:hypothetical protein